MSPAMNTGLPLICFAFVASSKKFRNSDVLDAPSRVVAHRRLLVPAKKLRIVLGDCKCLPNLRQPELTGECPYLLLQP